MAGTRAAVLTALLVALAVIPEPLLHEMATWCPIRGWSGRECPGCGMTRAAAALLQGDVVHAGVHNRGAYVLLPIAGLWLIRDGDRILRRRR